MDKLYLHQQATVFKNTYLVIRGGHKGSTLSKAPSSGVNILTLLPSLS